MPMDLTASDSSHSLERRSYVYRGQGIPILLEPIARHGSNIEVGIGTDLGAARPLESSPSLSHPSHGAEASTTPQTPHCLLSSLGMSGVSGRISVLFIHGLLL